MNKIICDSCKEGIKPKIENKFLGNSIVIQFFRCKCGEKYLIDVTDQTTRQKQIEYSKWAEQRNKALDIVIDGMTEEELNKLTMLIDTTGFNMDQLLAEIKEAKAQLKVKYGDKL